MHSPISTWGHFTLIGTPLEILTCGKYNTIMKTFLPLVLFPFLYGCPLPFHSGRMLSPGEIEMGIGGGAVFTGDAELLQQGVFIRRGLTRWMDAGIMMGAGYIAPDMRFRIIKGNEKCPSVSIGAFSLFYVWPLEWKWDGGNAYLCFQRDNFSVFTGYGGGIVSWIAMVALDASPRRWDLFYILGNLYLPMGVHNYLSFSFGWVKYREEITISSGVYASLSFTWRK